MKPKISVIVPAYNEAGRITLTLEAIHSHASRRGTQYEIIVVDDGSSDTTAELVEALGKQIPNLILLRHPSNKGKGAAVRTGMLAAKGQYRLFMDADGSTPIAEVDKLLPSMSEGSDVVIGSRRIDGSVIERKQPIVREILGYVFRFFSRTLVRIDVVDTQNGFKLFTDSAAMKLFSPLKTQGWGFDVEILLLARKKGLRVKEVGIHWTNDSESRMSVSGMVQMFKELLFLSTSRKSSKLRI